MEQRHDGESKGWGLQHPSSLFHSNTLLLLAEMLGPCSTVALFWSAGNIATFLPMGH